MTYSILFIPVCTTSYWRWSPAAIYKINTMNPKFKIILFYLCHADEELTLHELFAMFAQEDKDAFRSMDDISYHLNKLREQKKWVRNANPKKSGKREYFTWEITKAGQQALEHEQDDPQNTEEDIDHADKAENSSTNPRADSKDDAVEREEIIEITDPLAFYDSVHDSIRAMLETLLQQKPAQTIRNKQGKIGVLKYFNDFIQPINADFAIVLADIIHDLQNLEDTTNE